MEILSKCRLCFKRNGLNPIFVQSDKTERYTVALFLTTGLSIEPSDGMPQTVCLPCIRLVNSALLLRNTSHKAERKFLSHGFERTKINSQKHVEVCYLKNKPKTIDSRTDFENYERTDRQGNCEIYESHYDINSESSSIKDVKIKSEIYTETNSDENLYANQNSRDEKMRTIDKNASERSNSPESQKACENTKITQAVPTGKTQYAKSERWSRTSSQAVKQKRELLMTYVQGTFRAEGPITCKVCSATMSKWATFRNHCNRHLGHKFVCEYCGKRFFSITPLRRHKSSLHGETRALVCSQCSYRALDKQQLVIHERREHTKERPYICELCGASYYNRACLVQHIETHNTTKTVKCGQCASKFKSRRHLSRHVYTAHASAGFAYRCAVCRQLFRRRKYARAHMLKIHGLSTEQQGELDKLRVGTVT